MVKRVIMQGCVAALSLAAASPGAAASQGDAAAGQTVFARCAVCHSTAPDQLRVGPSLWGVVGRRPGSVPGYPYSAPMRAFGQSHVWDAATLFAYLQAPYAVVHGTNMSFRGLPDPADRWNVIAYLQTLQAH